MVCKQTLIKSIIYRIYSSSVAFFIALAVTGNIVVSTSIGVVDIFVKIFTYYAFDSAWKKITTKKYKTSVIWLTGLSGAGKTTIANNIFEKLKSQGIPAMLLDGDEVRGIFKLTGFDKQSRDEHVRGIGRIASFLESKGSIAIVSVISPYADIRSECRALAKNFIEVHISTSLKTCEQRDVKGLYAKARTGEIKEFTGISAPYEEPLNPELKIDTTDKTVDECANQLLEMIEI